MSAPAPSLLLVDCPTGLAGNMLLAALLDLGVPEAVIDEPLAALGLAGRYRLRLEERRSGGLRGRHLEVEVLERQPGHRPWGVLREQLEHAAWSEPLRQRVLAVFGLLAEAEARVHGHAPQQVHFHEVGAIDALVDVVGVCAGLLHLGARQLVCTPPPAGHGSVLTAHGRLPLPAPAVLEMARERAIPLAGSGGFPEGELTTPTGLALMACWAERFAPAPAHLPRAVGVGLGTRRLDRPNLLRLCLADPLPAAPSPPAAQTDLPAAQTEVFCQDAAWQQPAREPILESIVVQQALVDDASGEDLAFLAEALREGGALEVFSQPVAMKKGRWGQLLTALVRPEQAGALRQLWWRHGTSLGLREQQQPRWVLPRRQRQLETPLGPVRIKEAPGAEGPWRAKPEYDDLQTLARRHNRPIAEVRRMVLEHWSQEAASFQDPTPSQDPSSSQDPMP